MLIYKLQKKEDLSNSERILADFILANTLRVCNMSTREISSEAFVSSATVVRFAKKMGFDSYEQFKRQLYAEWKNTDEKYLLIDADFPYDGTTPYDTIFDRIAGLEKKAIQETRNLICLDKWNAVIEDIVCYNSIDIYGDGISYEAVHSFSSNMNRLGYNIFIEFDRSKQIHRSTNLFQDHFNLFLSYSGESPFSLSIAKMFHANKLKSLSITSDRPNQLMHQTTHHLSIARMEGRIQTGGISTICSTISFIFILDLIYSCVFQKKYEKNMKNLRKSIRAEMEFGLYGR
ncbi:MurR/RpiR family transcriptional regulator [Lacrimispora sp.]|uniref:MurR/RpiR family transcriptional regulator n=1 Tax=Lacrimispora sp. TaxID=2719234 RepID=UPI00289A3661|nr:MurR/RpiR family transcriptional regulator [Lacrimispora sp.]